MSDVQIIGSTIGGFRVEAEIGKGGMATVYRGVRDDIHRVVAIKLLERQFCDNADVVRRMRDEARAVNLVNHTDVVKIEDLGCLANGQAFVIMEYIPGQSLREFLSKEPPLPLLGTLRLGCRIAKAMAAVHRQGVIHRDLKPANVMIVKGSLPTNLDIKILDFGIAKVPPLDASSESNPATATNVFLFTVHYAGPEHFLRGSRHVTTQVDVYALGVILYEILAGRRPFLGSFEEVLTQLTSGRTPQALHSLCPDVPREITELVHAMLLRDPAARPTMEQVAARLEEWVALLESPSSAADQSRPALGRARRRGLFGFGVAVVIGVIMVGVALSSIKPGPDHRPKPSPIVLADMGAVGVPADLRPQVDQAVGNQSTGAADAAQAHMGTSPGPLPAPQRPSRASQDDHMKALSRALRNSATKSPDIQPKRSGAAP